MKIFYSEIDNIKIKIQKLVSLCLQLKKENEKRKEEIRAMQETIEEQNAEIIRMQDKNKILMLTKTIENSKQDTHIIRTHINEMLREIDKCIALLND